MRVVSRQRAANSQLGEYFMLKLLNGLIVMSNKCRNNRRGSERVLVRMVVDCHALLAVRQCPVIRKKRIKERPGYGAFFIQIATLYY